MIAFDLETHKIQPGLLAPPIVCGSFYGIGAGTQCNGVYKKDRYLRAIIETILNHHELVAGANIAYDFACVAAEWPELLPAIFDKYDRGEVFDVLLAQTLDAIAHGYLRDQMILDPRTGGQVKHPITGKQMFRYSLELVTDLCLNRVDAKANARFRLSYALLEKLPISEWPADAVEYPLDDARNTFDVAIHQISNHKNLHDMPYQVRAAFAEHMAAVWGLRTNAKSVEDAKAWYSWLKEGVQSYFASSDVYRPDGSKNMAALKQRVSDAYLGSPPTTATGAVSTARDVLEESGDEFLEGFAEVSKVDKMLDTYIPFVEQGVRAPINLKPNALLANGRSSYDGLIQLLPRKGGIRECFEARPGTVWCSVDYAAIELSTLAQVCLWTVGSSRLAESINDGTDPHSLFAARLEGTEYLPFLGLVKSGDQVAVDLRQQTKAANFGYPGMMGAVKFAISKRKEGLKLCLAARRDTICGRTKIVSWKGRECPPVCKLCVERAEELRLAYLDMWPEIPAYFNWVMSQLDASEGELVQFESNRIRGGLNGPAGANTLFSALAADGAKRALWRVSRECYTDRASPLFGSRVLIFAHDQIITEIPERSDVNAAANRQYELMMFEMAQVVPDVKVKGEMVLMRRWYKDAKPVRKDGKLVCWEPS